MQHCNNINKRFIYYRFEYNYLPNIRGPFFPAVRLDYDWLRITTALNTLQQRRHKLWRSAVDPHGNHIRKGRNR